MDDQLARLVVLGDLLPLDRRATFGPEKASEPQAGSPSVGAMEVRAVAAKAWQRFRGLPPWAQVVVGVVVLSVIVGPFLNAGEEREQAEEPAATGPDESRGGTSDCIDPPDDGAGGELLSARLAIAEGVLTISYETAAPLTGPSFSYYINIFSNGYQIGLRFIDDEVVQFVFDFAVNEQENLTGDYTLNGTVASMPVPLAAVPNLEESFDYTAVITVDGQDVDECAATFGS